MKQGSQSYTIDLSINLDLCRYFHSKCNANCRNKRKISIQTNDQTKLTQFITQEQLKTVKNRELWHKHLVNLSWVKWLYVKLTTVRKPNSSPYELTTGLMLQHNVPCVTATWTFGDWTVCNQVTLLCVCRYNITSDLWAARSVENDASLPNPNTAAGSNAELCWQTDAQVQTFTAVAGTRLGGGAGWLRLSHSFGSTNRHPDESEKSRT